MISIMKHASLAFLLSTTLRTQGGVDARRTFGQHHNSSQYSIDIPENHYGFSDQNETTAEGVAPQPKSPRADPLACPYAKRQELDLDAVNYTQDNIKGSFSYGWTFAILKELNDVQINFFADIYKSSGSNWLEIVKVAESKNNTETDTQTVVLGRAEVETGSSKKVTPKQKKVSGYSANNSAQLAAIQKKIAAKKLAEAKNQTVTIQWPTELSKTTPIPGMKFKIAHVNTRTNLAVLEDDHLLVGEIVPALEHIAYNRKFETKNAKKATGSIKGDEPPAKTISDVIESDLFKAATAARVLPPWDTLRAVYDEENKVYWSLDNRRLFSLKSVWRESFAGSHGRPARAEFAVYNLRGDLMNEAKVAKSEALARAKEEFLKKKFTIHGYTLHEDVATEEESLVARTPGTCMEKGGEFRKQLLDTLVYEAKMTEPTIRKLLNKENTKQFPMLKLDPVDCGRIIHVRTFQTKSWDNEHKCVRFDSRSPRQKTRFGDFARRFQFLSKAEKEGFLKSAKNAKKSVVANNNEEEEEVSAESEVRIPSGNLRGTSACAATAAEEKEAEEAESASGMINIQDGADLDDWDADGAW